MTQTTEDTALAMVNQICREKIIFPYLKLLHSAQEIIALCRAIEQRDAINTALRATAEACADHVNTIVQLRAEIAALINPKPDPLVAALEGVTFDHYPPNDAKTIRAALDKLGFEIREKNDD